MATRLISGITFPLLVSTALAHAVVPASAQIYCSEPIVPYCLDSRSTGGDSSSVMRCREDVETFAEDVADYLACLDENAASLRAKVKAMREKIENMEREAKRGEEPEATRQP